MNRGHCSPDTIQCKELLLLRGTCNSVFSFLRLLHTRKTCNSLLLQLLPIPCCTIVGTLLALHLMRRIATCYALLIRTYTARLDLSLRGKWWTSMHCVHPLVDLKYCCGVGCWVYAWAFPKAEAVWRHGGVRFEAVSNGGCEERGRGRSEY